MSKEHACAYEAGYRDGSIHYELEHCPACKNVADLQEALAKNAKLWELIVEVFGCARRGESCEMCKVNNDGYACVYIMRELGVEVDA